MVYHLNIGKLKRNNGGVEERRGSMFPYRITLGQLAFKITVGTAEKKN